MSLFDADDYLSESIVLDPPEISAEPGAQATADTTVGIDPLAAQGPTDPGERIEAAIAAALVAPIDPDEPMEKVVADAILLEAAVDKVVGAIDDPESDVAQSDVAQSDVAQSEVAQSEVAQSDLAQSEMADSDVADVDDVADQPDEAR